MRRVLAALAAVALVATGCSDGVRRGAPTPTTTTSATASTEPVAGMLAFATRDQVRAVAPDGTVRRLATQAEAVDLAMSGDGRYVAYVTSDAPVDVVVYDLAASRWRSWVAPSDEFYAARIAWSGGRFVVVANDTLLRFDPAAFVGGADPESVPLTGVTDARLLAANDHRILVGVSEPDFASARGGPETVFEVDVRGRTTRLFNDGDGGEEGEVRNLPIGAAALTADGRRLVYGSGVGGFGPAECDLGFALVVRDLVANRELPIPAPAFPGDVLTVYGDVTTGPDGRTVVGLTSEAGGCSQEPGGAAYVLDGDRWRLLARNATWAATGPGGDLATIDHKDVLRVGGRRVATGVVRAVWSPVKD